MSDFSERLEPTFAFPGIGGSLGKCALCGEAFVVEIEIMMNEAIATLHCSALNQRCTNDTPMTEGQAMTKADNLVRCVRLFANDGRLGRELDIYRNWPQDLRDAFWDMCNACDELMEEISP